MPWQTKWERGRESCQDGAREEEDEMQVSARLLEEEQRTTGGR